VTVRLIDTNIVSYSMKNHPLALRYRPHLSGYQLAISFMTVGELYAGAYAAKWGPRRMSALDATVGGLLVLESDPPTCRLFGQVLAWRKAQPIGIGDAWIAATALAHGLELVTHNPSDFQGIAGLTVITEAP
jgi:tRNA(fMet)-specific endonuclease VapC